MKSSKLFGVALGCCLLVACPSCGDGDSTSSSSGGGGTGGAVTGGGGAASTTCGTETCSLDDGVTVADKNDNDCKKIVCRGHRQCTENEDDEFPLDDGDHNPCTKSVCKMGEASHADEGTWCNVTGGQACDGKGNCVPCLDDSMCKAEPGDPEKTCDLETHTCAIVKCILGDNCSSKVCDHNECLVADCPDGVTNGNESGVDCGGDQCPQCVDGQKCDGNGDNCVSGFCVDGVCCDLQCMGDCSSCALSSKPGKCDVAEPNTDPHKKCPAGEACNGQGGCAKVKGAMCTIPEDCANSQCHDGYCCDKACTGECRSCGLLNKEGTCTFHKTGTDPENECNDLNPNCNGADACGP